MIELLIVLVVIAIMVSLTLPSYRQYMRRAHRGEIVGELVSMAACQERWRSILGHYDTSRCSQQAGGKHYRIDYDPADEPNATDFLLIAQPIGGQKNDPCGSLRLDHTGLRSVEGRGVNALECWAGR